ncbi:non-canonical purine NTP pyrophosphatase, RdgB/HAM1 family [Candidatus Micrarchaeota archaeon CG10_big_fil_rev_8_21_14_0_10_45_29]|nr:MAG: non-canonical purine NTP pyrophosphatase, RdgB/HAM1 family [Candidatus Micrarchaeota archaeon CG10_big_fil_rev_8_21_14_0_10_45_29]
MNEILFLTSNKHKITEAQTILNKYNLKLVSFPGKGEEIQSDSLQEVARICAKRAYLRIKKPLFVEDSGLFIDALNGFPGAYSAFALDKIGCEGILRLLGQERLRGARFECAVAYADKNGTRIFTGAVLGSISTQIFEGEGFGYDPIFIPEGHKQTFSKNFEVKEKISHRSIALEKLAKFLTEKKE